MTTDIAYLVSVLDDGCWHTTSELLRRSIEDRGHGLTVHSRISDLRRKGFKVEHRRVPGERAAAHQYRLVEAALPQRVEADVRFLLEAELGKEVQSHAAFKRLPYDDCVGCGTKAALDPSELLCADCLAGTKTVAA